MQTTITSFIFVIFTCLFAQASFTDVCWKDSYGRGVGAIPLECGNYDKSGLLCYPKCRDGYTGVAFVCWQNCPSGFTDTGAHCLKPKPYGRGAGYAIWNEGKCNNENKQGCEKSGLIWYPRCAPSFHAVGCCVCSPDCPKGTKDIGVSCQKDSYTRRTITPNCGDKQYDTGLCYKACGDKYNGIGPVCWGKCPPELPVDCGAMCGKAVGDCVSSILDQVMAVGSLVAKIASIVVTGGAAVGGELAAEAAEQSAISALKNTAKDIAKKFIKESAKQAKAKIMAELKKVPGVTDHTADGLSSIASDPEGFDYKSFLKSLDPIGISKVVDAFNKKICPNK